MPDTVVVITGASSGIGAAVATLLAGRGSALALVARRADALQVVATACGGRAHPIVADVTHRDQVRHVVQATMNTFAEGLKTYCSRDFETARRLFEQTSAERKGGDGPARFYLEEIKKHEHTELPKDWNGVVNLDQK